MPEGNWREVWNVHTPQSRYSLSNTFMWKSRAWSKLENHRKSSFSNHRTKKHVCMQQNYGESETMNTLDCDSKVWRFTSNEIKMLEKCHWLCLYISFDVYTLVIKHNFFLNIWNIFDYLNILEFIIFHSFQLVLDVVVVLSRLLWAHLIAPLPFAWIIDDNITCCGPFYFSIIKLDDRGLPAINFHLLHTKAICSIKCVLFV